jgi:formamidopyrimidine-DNA glycosylase
VHFADPRLFGRMEPASAGELRELDAVKALGRDPLADGLTPTQLREAVGDSKQDLKVALMDQSRVAGLGNIHAAEALFRAGIHPARKPPTLTPDEWKRLARAIHAALDFGLKEQEGEEPVYLEERGSQNLFRIYGRAGESCAKCRAKVQSFTQGGRTTHFCPKCQPARGPSSHR